MSEGHERRPECLALAERLSEYIDGELPEDLRREVEEHFKDCARCDGFLESLARVRDLGGRLREPLLTPEALQRIAARAKERLDG
jgi:anti-sigma factor RsiW